jgi:hypothetical protein
MRFIESFHIMDSHSIARYMEDTQGEFKPWLLIQLRLEKLKESKGEMSADEYMQRVNDLQADLMNLGDWWVGREDEVFGPNP